MRFPKPNKNLANRIVKTNNKQTENTQGNSKEIEKGNSSSYQHVTNKSQVRSNE